LYWKGTKQQIASKNEFNRQFSKEVQVANKYIKKKFNIFTHKGDANQNCIEAMHGASCL
jgi:hypothetical protein